VKKKVEQKVANAHYYAVTAGFSGRDPHGILPMHDLDERLVRLVEVAPSHGQVSIATTRCESPLGKVAGLIGGQEQPRPLLCAPSSRLSMHRSA
jgi:hypothetical protein